MIAIIVYILCAATSALCACLLFRHYHRSRSRLLFWSGICFGCFGVSNCLLFIDLILLPNVDLSPIRNGITLIGLAVLIYGLISSTD